MENATYKTTLEVNDQESPDHNHPAYTNTALSQVEAAPRPSPYGHSEPPQENSGHPDFPADPTPPYHVTQTVPDNIVEAEFGASPHCMPPHWPRKAPAP